MRASAAERAMKADLEARRAALTAERDRSMEMYRRLSEAIPMLTGALNEIERLLAGFDTPQAAPIPLPTRAVGEAAD